MTIEFHCDHCGHLVRTGAEHAGKRGRCPHCHQNVYIPTPSDQIEPLRLAPTDDQEERERKRLDEESRAVARALREEKEAPPDLVKTPLPEPVGDVRLPSDVETLIIQYALCMADGKLNEAQELAVEIRMDLDRAQGYIQRLTMDELPPTRLAHIPRAVLLGFLKQLRK
jgi:hypothetical protein